jgi:hypothetical protein
MSMPMMHHEISRFLAALGRSSSRISCTDLMRISPHRVLLFSLSAMGIAGCSNPLPVGPGRVDINLQQVKVLLVDHAKLFPGAPQRSGLSDPRAALELTISSPTELLRYFAEWDRQVQVRCSVDGNLNGKSYLGVTTKPVLKTPGPSKQYEYTVYAFIDLKADDSEYKAGRPATTLDLRTESFEALKCHFLGVTMAPVLFPRSNDVVVSEHTFRTLHTVRNRHSPPI